MKLRKHLLVLLGVLALALGIGLPAEAQRPEIRDADGTAHLEFGDIPSRVHSIEARKTEPDDRDPVPASWLNDGYKPPQPTQEEVGTNYCSEIREGLRAELHAGRVVFSAVAMCTPEKEFQTFGEFSVVRSWRGPLRPGETASVLLLNEGGCGYEPVQAGQQYLFVIPCEESRPSLRQTIACRASQPNPLAHVPERVAFLDSTEPPAKRDEVIEVLQSWSSGSSTVGETYDWFKFANSFRDLADWETDDAWLDHQILTSMEGFLRMGISAAAARNCTLRRDIASDVIRLLSENEGSAFSGQDVWRQHWNKLWHSLRHDDPCEPDRSWLDKRSERPAPHRATELRRSDADSPPTEIAIRIKSEVTLDALAAQAPEAPVDSAVFANGDVQLTLAVLNPPTFDLQTLLEGIRWECVAEHELRDQFMPELDSSCWQTAPLPTIRTNILQIRFVSRGLAPGRHVFRAHWQDPRSGHSASSEERSVLAYAADESLDVHRALLISKARVALRSGNLDGYSCARAMFLEAAEGNPDPSIYEELADASAPWAPPFETASFYHRWLDLTYRQLVREYGTGEKWPVSAAALYTKRRHKVLAFDYLVGHYSRNASELRVDVVLINGTEGFKAEWRKNRGIWQLIILK